MKVLSAQQSPSATMTTVGLLSFQTLDCIQNIGDSYRLLVLLEVEQKFKEKPEYAALLHGLKKLAPKLSHQVQSLNPLESKTNLSLNEPNCNYAIDTAPEFVLNMIAETWNDKAWTAARWRILRKFDYSDGALSSLIAENISDDVDRDLNLKLEGKHSGALLELSLHYAIEEGKVNLKTIDDYLTGVNFLVHHGRALRILPEVARLVRSQFSEHEEVIERFNGILSTQLRNIELLISVLKHVGERIITDDQKILQAITALNHISKDVLPHLRISSSAQVVEEFSSQATVQDSLVASEYLQNAVKAVDVLLEFQHSVPNYAGSKERVDPRDCLFKEAALNLIRNLLSSLSPNEVIRISEEILAEPKQPSRIVDDKHSTDRLNLLQVLNDLRSALSQKESSELMDTLVCLKKCIDSGSASLTRLRESGYANSALKDLLIEIIIVSIAPEVSALGGRHLMKFNSVIREVKSKYVINSCDDKLLQDPEESIDANDDKFPLSRLRATLREVPFESLSSELKFIKAELGKLFTFPALIVDACLTAWNNKRRIKKDSTRHSLHRWSQTCFEDQI